MTKRKHLKRRVRARAAKTGESYTAALRHLRITNGEEMTATFPTAPALTCSFCNKSDAQVKKLIAGPGVFICDECIGLCNKILDEEVGGASPPDQTKSAWSLADGPIEELMLSFSHMAAACATFEARLAQWATALHARGVAVADLASCAQLTESEAADRFGFSR